MIRGLINHFRHRHDGYDRRGDAIVLLDRTPDCSSLQIPGVSPAVVDQTLELICNSFGIPRRQMHCLRLGDELKEIYRSFNGMRTWDRLEFESMGLAMDKLSGQPIAREKFWQLRTVEDVIRFVTVLRARKE
jgi:hypothetical protein